MIGILIILDHHFRTFRAGQVRKISIQKIILFICIPCILSAAWSCLIGPIESKQISTYLAILAVVGSILTAMLAVVQAVIGFPLPHRNEPFTPVEIVEFRRLSARLTTLRELYANISYSVVLVIVAMPSFLVLAFEPSTIFYYGFSTFIYFVCLTLILTFFYIVSGVYIVLDAQGRKMTEELERLKPGSSQVTEITGDDIEEPH